MVRVLPLALFSAVLAAAPAARADEEAWAELPPAADTAARPDAPPVEPPMVEPETPALAEFRARVRALSAQRSPPPLVVELYRPGMFTPPPSLVQQAPPPPGPPVPPVAVPSTNVTLQGGRVLDKGTFGLSGFVGLPTYGLRAGYGVAPGWDVGVGYGGLYTLSQEFSAHGRRELSRGDFEWALTLDASYVLFAKSPGADAFGARFFTGRRNFNLAPGAAVSKRNVQGNFRWWASTQLLLALDTEPVSTLPLGGVPPPVVLGWNLPLLAGGEWALSSVMAFQLSGGFELHGRSGDAFFVPQLRAGFVFGL